MRILVLPGDGIGPEIAAAMAVLTRPNQAAGPLGSRACGKAVAHAFAPP